MSVVNVDFRKKPTTPKKVVLPEDPRWFCTVCAGDIFKLYSSGDVHCTGCGVRISNVRVSK